ncbi:uncharacterized protein LOC105397669 [Plutella xylostella]|uniref:uncharacterized protein LOC105397669 n=1 Tax=Plutella xylostella TaxID=51655 RepID=UPI002032E94E|nr:uncharacterized protein LOC105397669 [Plutella xylostella]
METSDPDSAVPRDMDDSGCVQDESPTKMEEPPPARVNLLDLSDDVLLCILRYCEPRDLKALGFTCARLGELIRERSLWRRLVERSQSTGRARLRWYLRRVLGPQTEAISLRGYAADVVTASVEQDDPVPAPAPVPAEPRAGGSRDVDVPAAYLGEPAHPMRLPATYCIRGTDSRQMPRITWTDADSSSGVRWSVSRPLLQQLTARCPQLTVLALDYCNLDAAEINLSQFPRLLRSLSLEGVKCYNLPVDKSFMFRVHDYLPLLESVNISLCAWVCGAALLPLSKLRSLRVLAARGCKRLAEFVAYASLAARYGFRNLKVLDVRGSPLADSEVSAFGWLPLLEELYCSVQQPDPPPLQNAEVEPELWSWEKEEPEYLKEPLLPEDPLPPLPPRTPTPPPAPRHAPASAVTITLNRRQVDAGHSDAHPVGNADVPGNNEMGSGEEMKVERDHGDGKDEMIGGDNEEMKEVERDVKDVVEGPDVEMDAVESNREIEKVEGDATDDAKADNVTGDSKAPEIPAEQDDQQAGGVSQEVVEEKAKDLRIDPGAENEEMEVEPRDLRIDSNHNENDRNNDNTPIIAATINHIDKNHTEELSDSKMHEAGPSNSEAAENLDIPGPSYANPPEVKDLSTVRNGLKRKPDVDVYDYDDDDEPAVKKPYGSKDGASTSNGTVQKFVKFRRNCPPVVITKSENGEVKENGLNLVKKKQNGTAIASNNEENGDKTQEVENMDEGDKKDEINANNAVENGENQEQNANAIIEANQNGEVNIRNPRHVIIAPVEQQDRDDAQLLIDPHRNEVIDRPRNPPEYEIIEQAPPVQRVEEANNRYHVLYVNVGRQLHAVYQLSADFEVPPNRQMPDQEPRLDIRNIYRQMRFPYVRNVIYGPPTPHIDPSSLITDSALRRFGRSDGEDINYVHIGIPRPGDASTERPSKSRLRILVCTGYSGVTNSSLSHLATAAPDLTLVDVTGTKVNEQGVEAFRILRPDCQVLYGNNT